MRPPFCTRPVATGLLAALVLSSPAAAQTVAHDDASSSAYNSGWFNGQASGTGFSNWVVQLPSGATAGVASSSDNDNFEPGLANINTAGRALRLVSSNGSTVADALRTFNQGALQVGQVFTIWIDNGSIQTGGVVGFGLQNHANANNRFELYFTGGTSNYTINDGAGSPDSGIGFTRGGLRIAFQLETANSYRMNVVRNGAPTANVFLTRNLTGTSGSGIDKLRVFNFNAGGNSFTDAFFSNQFDISNGFVWDGGGSTNQITLPDNWKLDVPPIRSEFTNLHFSGTTRLTPVFSAAPNFVKNIEFDPGAGAFVLSGEPGAALTVFNGIFNNSSSVQTIDIRVLVNSNVGDQVVTFHAGSASGGALRIGSNGTLDINLETRTLHWTGANAGTIDAVVTGSGKFVKSGTGMLHMADGVTHLYSGTTTVSGGTLRVNGTLGPHTISSPAQTVIVGNGSPGSGVLAGSGIISRPVTINSGGTISPGSGEVGNASTIGTMTINTGGGITSGLLTLEGGGAWVVQVNRRSDEGTEGVNWDTMNVAALAVNATTGNKFVVRVVSLNASHQSGAVPNWDPDVPQSWRVAMVSGTVTGFDINKFEIDLTQFASHNPLKSVFYLSRSGGDIHLRYVPEPSWTGIVLWSAAFLRRSRRVRSA